MRGKALKVEVRVDELGGAQAERDHERLVVVHW